MSAVQLTEQELDRLFADSRAVNDAFLFVEATYSRAPCRDCQGTNTTGIIMSYVVCATCEDCGTRTDMGRLGALWHPSSSAVRPARRPTVRRKSFRNGR